MSDYFEKGVPEIADEITSYLTAHKRAADTLEGVTDWWITRHRVAESRQLVQEALRLLIRRGTVKCESLGDGRMLYSLNEDACGNG